VSLCPANINLWFSRGLEVNLTLDRLAVWSAVAMLTALIGGCGGGGVGDTTPPAIIATQPATHARGVRLSPPITVTFSKDVHPLSIRRDTFVVAGASGTVSYDRKRRMAMFKPDVNLAPDHPYTATVTNGVFDLHGNRLRANFSWSFTTGDQAAITPLFSFDGANAGADPKGSLTLVNIVPGAGATPVPTLFGRTAAGGANGGGVIFSLPIAPASATPAIYSFADGSGCQPHHDSMTLLDAAQSPGATPVPTLFGTALFTKDCSGAGSGNGFLFSVDATAFAQGAPAYAAVHHFGGPPSDGSNAHSCLAAGTGEPILYGATAEGGANSGGEACGSGGCGTIYSYNPFATPSPAYQVLHSFNSGATTVATPAPSSTSSACPAPTPTATGDTSSPAPTPAAMPTVIPPCPTCTGAVPHGRPVVVNNGAQDVLLGITRQGGIATDDNAPGNGVIYAFIPAAAAYTPIHYFTGAPTDGAYTDHGNLTVGEVTPGGSGMPLQAMIYGMTTQGGSGVINDKSSGPTAGSGVIFSALVNLPQSGAPAIAQYIIMHDFAPCSTSRSNPAVVADLVGGGLVPDGYNPFGSLLYSGGWLYGMTRDGGLYGGGAIFRMSPDPACAGQLNADCYGIMASFDTPKNTETSKGHCHCTTADSPPDSCNPTGSAPIDNLIASTDGNTLFGMTQTGGANDLCNENGYGTVFAIAATP
jgi:Bacterial Ig-like domain